MKKAIAKRLLPALLATGMISGCTTSLLDRADHSSGRAFIKYWPPPKNDTSIRLAVKDLIDVQGMVTSAAHEWPGAGGVSHRRALRRRQRNVPSLYERRCQRTARSPLPFGHLIPIDPLD